MNSLKSGARETKQLNSHLFTLKCMGRAENTEVEIRKTEKELKYKEVK